MSETNICKHEFVDVYDEIEIIPAEIVSLASSFDSNISTCNVLDTGKLKTKKHAMTYCKLCGFKVGCSSDAVK